MERATNQMIAATNTPGPWTAEQQGEALTIPGPLVILGPKRETVAEVFAVHIVGNGEGEKNAQLIAAAPELLAALQLMVREILPLAHGRRFTAPRRAAVEQARQAIHKAKS